MKVSNIFSPLTSNCLNNGIRVWGLIYIMLLQFTLVAQHIQCLSTPPLSQNTNFYIFQSSEKKMFISSSDGVNVFDGKRVKIYNRSNSGLLDNNIQSNFFEDSQGNIWFTSYEAFYAYCPKRDSVAVFQSKGLDGKTTTTDYRIFQQLGDTLVMKIKDELVLFHTLERKIIFRQNVQLLHCHNLQFFKLSGKSVILYGTNELNLLELGMPLSRKNTFPVRTSFLLKTGDALAVVGTYDGKLVYFDVNKGKIEQEQQVSSNFINGIVRYKRAQLLVSDQKSLLLVDEKARGVTDQIHLMDQSTQKVLQGLIIPYLDQDRVIWIGCNGSGVFYKDLENIKFQHWLAGTSSAPENFVHKILENKGKFYALTRATGIYELDQVGKVTEHSSYSLAGRSEFRAFSGCFVDSQRLLFTDQADLYQLNTSTNRITKLKCTNNRGPSFLFRIEKLLDGRVVGNSSSEGLLEFKIRGNTYSWSTLISLGNNVPITNFAIDKRGHIFVTANDEKTLVYVYSYLGKCVPFKQVTNIKTINGICEDQVTRALYAASNDGLYRIDPKTFTAQRIVDLENALDCKVHSILQDSSNQLWMSTNKGLYSYRTIENKGTPYRLKDGLQALEFAKEAVLLTSDGRMLFGGLNGINAFDPVKVKSSKTIAPVMLNELKVNDVVTSAFGDPNFLSTLTLPYYENTLSFSFHAIDYFDPQMPLLKYKLEGVDNDFVFLEGNEGFARYAKLKPDEYTLVIYGSNADGVWNNTPKKLRINILPPFWQTWWFRSFAVVVLCLLLYLSVKHYLAQQLAQKDLQLREQRLTIDKQLAVQTERDRIAAEMHDDLGGGLTSIKFLSQRVLKQIASDKDKSGIQKIVDQSGQLITNMSEIIWAMNSGFDSLESLLAYMRRFAFEFFEPTDIQLSFVVKKDLVDHQLTGQQRRNIFLVVKEALHNCAKHSAATIVVIETTQSNEQTLICIQDNGVGISPTVEPVGNGLENMRKRMVAIGGTLQIENSKGTKVTLRFQANP